MWNLIRDWLTVSSSSMAGKCKVHVKITPYFFYDFQDFALLLARTKRALISVANTGLSYYCLFRTYPNLMAQCKPI